MDRSVAIAEQTVMPIAMGEARDVSAMDLADAMLRAGFSPEQIMKDGPAIRAALAASGGAQVRYNRLAEAIFAVHGFDLLVTSRTRGTFAVPLRPVV
jgi:hypothetical protein